MDLLSGGMQSRWGRMLEKKKERLQASSSSYQPAITGPPLEKMKKKIVAVGQVGSGTTCPECRKSHNDLGLDSIQDFKLHVFQCRVQRGTNPLLPVVSLVPHPPKRPPDKSTYPGTNPTEFDLTNRRHSIGVKRYKGSKVPSAGVRGFSCPEVGVVVSSGYHSSSSFSAVDKSEPRDNDHDRRVMCTKVNRLALKRLLTVKRYRKDDSAEEKLHKLLAASHQEAEFDLSEVDLSSEDVAVVANLVTDHPSAALLALNSQLPSSVTSVLAPALFTVAANNRNLIHITNSKSLGSDWSSKLGVVMEKSIQNLHLQQQDQVVDELGERYAKWEQVRRDTLHTMQEEEAAARKAIKHEMSKQSKTLRKSHTSEFKVLRIRQRRKQIADMKSAQRKLFCDKECRTRESVVATELYDLLVLFVQKELLEREYLNQYQYMSRRQVKIIEEKSHKHSKGRERARLDREHTARRMLDDTECDQRIEVECDCDADMEFIQAKFEEGIAYFAFLDRQGVIREDLQKLCMSMRQTIEKDEQDSRQWIIDRKLHYTQMKEQERARARELVAQAENQERMTITDDFVKASELLDQEVTANLEWLREVVLLASIEEEFTAVMRRLPDISIENELQYNTKPFTYFVHPYSEVEPPTWINTGAKFGCSLEETWADAHREITKKQQAQAKAERDAYTLLNRVRTKNAKFFSKIFPETEAQDDDKKRKGKKLKASVQVALKLGGMTSMAEKTDVLPKLTPEQISDCKQVMWGGYIEVRLQPSDTDPSWLAETIEFSCKTYLDVEVDGVVHKGSGCLSDMVESHPAQFELPANPTTNSDDVGGDESTPVSVESPCGKVLRVLLPNPETAERQPEDEIDTNIITRIIRSCKVRTTGHGLPSPVLVQVLFNAVLMFDSSVSIKDPSIRPTNLTAATGTSVMGVVLALPFISQCSSKGLSVEFIEGMKSDELQLMPEPFSLTDPPTVTRRKDQDHFSVMSGGHQGGGLSLTNFHDSFITVEISRGYTSDDVICIRNNAKVYLEGTNIFFRDRDTVHQVGRVVQGCLSSSGEVQDSGS